MKGTAVLMLMAGLQPDEGVVKLMAAGVVADASTPQAAVMLVMPPWRFRPRYCRATALGERPAVGLAATHAARTGLRLGGRLMAAPAPRRCVPPCSQRRLRLRWLRRWLRRRLWRRLRHWLRHWLRRWLSCWLLALRLQL